MGSTNLKRDIPLYATFYQQGRLNLDDFAPQEISLSQISDSYDQLKNPREHAYGTSPVRQSPGQGRIQKEAAHAVGVPWRLATVISEDFQTGGGFVLFSPTAHDRDTG